MRVLVLNCGSSSVGCSLYDDETLLFDAKAHRVGVRGTEAPWVEVRVPRARRVEAELADHSQAAEVILDLLLGEGLTPDAVGHRFVHGGERSEPMRVRSDDPALEALVPLAPLHNAFSLAAMRAVSARFPDVDHVLVFDTAFHAGMPAAARVAALPNDLAWRFARVGFHGLSYRSVVDALTATLGTLPERLVICHLGTGGSSATAVLRGNSMDTSMAASPLAGLIMSTRCGDLDPAAALDLAREQGVDATLSMLNRESGLLGLSGLSPDIRDLLARADDIPRARLAVDAYFHRLSRTIGALTASLGGLDALAFTDDVGLRLPEVRAGACARLGFLGIRLDTQANLDANGAELADVSTPDAQATVWVVPNDEELVVARATREVLS